MPIVTVILSGAPDAERGSAVAQAVARPGARWRHAGSIQLIAGVDLATANLEPHELLDYVRGALRTRLSSARTPWPPARRSGGESGSRR